MFKKASTALRGHLAFVGTLRPSRISIICYSVKPILESDNTVICIFTKHFLCAGLFCPFKKIKTMKKLSEFWALFNLGTYRNLRRRGWLGARAGSTLVYNCSAIEFKSQQWHWSFFFEIPVSKHCFIMKCIRSRILKLENTLLEFENGIAANIVS